MADKILTIIGPTAVGKTSISIEIAKRMNGEIIGLDSRQIYFDMEIGTAQPTINEQNGIRHHLIGIRSPDKIIAAGEYAEMVNAVIVDIKEREKIPIICGGAGLYYRALHKGIFKGSISDIKTRKRLENQFDKNPKILLKRLHEIDPDYAKIVHINNKKRMVRALEIFELTGITPTVHFRKQKENPTIKLDLYTILFTIDRNLLFERICERTKQMLDNGLVDEVEHLLIKYKESEVHPLDSIGYKQVKAYLNQKLNYEEMIDEINIRTRQYAKKQMTWFNSEPIDLRIDIEKNTKIDEIIDIVINSSDK